jgi:hypothetical protein
MQNTKYGKLVAVMICVSFLLVLIAQVNQARAAGETKIIIDPELIQVSGGDNFTIVINATNIAVLSTWQLTLKYDASVMNLTAMWVPAGISVFGSAIQIPVEPDLGIDLLDSMGYVNYGNALLGDPVSVSNGILCMANVTALAEGQTTILIATSSNRAHKTPNEYDAFYSYVLDADNVEVPYTTKSATMIVGGGASKPIALFTATGTGPLTGGNLVLPGHPPTGDLVYAQAYKGYSVTFNASASFGVITLDNETKVIGQAAIGKYNWDFNDGNLTSTNDPIITHTYDGTGSFIAKLTVEDKENPPATSDSVQLTIVVGLVLPRFDWTPFIYAVFAIIIVGAVFYAAKELKAHIKQRRELKARRLLSSKRMPTMPT